MDSYSMDLAMIFFCINFTEKLLEIAHQIQVVVMFKVFTYICFKQPRSNDKTNRNLFFSILFIRLNVIEEDQVYAYFKL